jgi:hypothetical protein
MTRLVFLDIDDVLLTDRALSLPSNVARLVAMERGEHYGQRIMDGLPNTFDPVAVAWLNRLTDVAAARVVIHSSWRYHIGEEDTVPHVLGQGVLRLHDDSFCPMAAHACDKHLDIRAWLERHRDEAVAWVVLDDETRLGQALADIGLLAGGADDGMPPIGQGRYLRIDPATGFGPSDYFDALDHFGGADTMMAQVSSERKPRSGVVD